MARWPALAMAGMLAASAAYAFPRIDGNTPEQARTYGMCDTITTPAGPTGRTRTIYLVSGTTVGIDSVITAWRAGGAQPDFRRIQGIRICSGNGAEAAINMTIHRAGATCRNKLSFWAFFWTSIPVEADSIVISSSTATPAVLSYCIW